MKSLWNDQDAERYTGYLGQRVYTSRLLGAEASLVMHGGGNTSMKGRTTNIFGEEEEVLFVKGSGWDLETIDTPGFAPCRMNHLLRLAQLESLSDTQMATELRLCLTDVSAPSPSVEAILHAILPARYVDHTHADAVLAITNTPFGGDLIRELFGEELVYIPYVMPGFKLARLCAQLYPRQAGSKTIGMLLLNHGLFSFGDTAKESYERMITLVTRAEEYLRRRAPDSFSTRTPLSCASSSGSAGVSRRADIAALRAAVSATAGGPMILSTHSDEGCLEFARRPDVADVSQQGPATPDHVIRTKRVPLIGRDVESYTQAYKKYFSEHGTASLKMLDPAPRVILDPEFGMCTIGKTAKDAAIVEDIYRHTIDIIEWATSLGGWRALPPKDIFEVEYWDLEQAKLRTNRGAPLPFTGEIALVTGAASGIGKACVAAYLSRGAAVVGVDVASSVVELHHRKDYLGIRCDLTDESAVRDTLERTAATFGGLDILVLNAGIFPASAPIASLSSETWRKTMSINLDANLFLMRECHPLLKLAPRGGRVLLIGSKNVPAPGPGVAAYSASKAALQQMARVAALEWGTDHIRVNTLHPNGVFDTGIWTAEVLAARAASYHMTVDEYKRNNVLQIEVTSEQVATLAAEVCGPTFSRTTGAQIPIDGGNVRVI